MSAYQCPICKKQHALKHDAIACLGEHLSEKYSVEEKYECPLCGEIYDHEGSAWECAAECYLREKDLSLKVGHAPGQCDTCTALAKSGYRVWPCPHVNDVTPPDTCGAYDPDVRHFGCHIATQHRLATLEVQA